MDAEEVLQSLKEAATIHPLSWRAILACVLSGGIVGFERHRHGKPIGMRTNILICLGTYTFVAAGHAVTTEMSDPTRVIGQVISGIGFLGAGVILTRHGIVVGVTTAASIWMLAGIGVVIATQPPFLGVKLSVLCVLILTCVGYIEHGVEKLGSKATDTLKPDGSDSANGALDIEPLDVGNSAGAKHSELEKHEHE